MSTFRSLTIVHFSEMDGYKFARSTWEVCNRGLKQSRSDSLSVNPPLVARRCISTYAGAARVGYCRNRRYRSGEITTQSAQLTKIREGLLAGRPTRFLALFTTPLATFYPTSDSYRPFLAPCYDSKIVRGFPSDESSRCGDTWCIIGIFNISDISKIFQFL